MENMKHRLTEMQPKPIALCEADSRAPGQKEDL
jgi:hypothetical protein